MQVFLDQGKPRDLKTTSAITLNLRIPQGLTDSRVFFQAGTLAEDFDGTRAVRTIDYRSWPALAFYDQRQGIKQYFPVPENSAWGNDAEADGTAGEDGTLVTRELTTISNSSPDWQSVRLVLTDAERQILQRTTGWRMVLVPGSGTGTQTLLAGAVVFEGAAWSVKSSAPATGSVNPAEQVDSSRTEGHQLRVDWSGKSDWTIEARHSPVRPGSYRTIAFQFRNQALASSTTFGLALTDADGTGVHATWSAGAGAATSGWIQGRINLREKTLTLDGVPTGTVTVTSGAVSWNRMSISKSSATDSGTWMLAEVEAVDPVWEPLGTSLVSATWKQSAAWPSTEIPLVSGMVWDVTSAQAGLTADDWSWIGKTTAAGNLGPVRASGEASLHRSAGGQGGHGAYQATLPLGWPDGPTLELTDKFSDLGLRAERVVLGVPWVGTWDGQVKAEGPPTTLDRQYKAGWTSPSQWPAGWSAALTGTADETSPWSGTLGDFGPQWVDSWSWLPPPDTPAPYSLVQAEATTTATWQPWSLETHEKGLVSQSVGPTVKWAPSGSWEIKTPYKVEGDRAWSLTPSVSKRVESVFETATPEFPDESARKAAVWLGTQPQGLFALPFDEQLSMGSPWTGSGLQTGLVESTVGLDWERATVADWTDVALPTLGGAKFVTTRGVDGLAEYRSGLVAGHLQARGLNLFGTLGSTPVFSWYRTDVWTWSATGSWGTGTRVQDQTADASMATRADLVLTTQESVGLPVDYQGKWGSTPTQSVGVKPTWTLRRPADLPFELPRWISPGSFHREWVQELSSSLQFGWDPTVAPVLRDLQVSWKGRFLLSEKSELDLTTKWGQQWQNNLTVVGLEASLDLILAF